MTKTCLQCGAILAIAVRTCHFCDSSVFAQTSTENASSSPIQKSFASTHERGTPVAPCAGVAIEAAAQNAPWQGELAERMAAYRVRKRKVPRNANQARFSFGELGQSAIPSITLADTAEPPREDFAFTVAIGRRTQNPEMQHGRMEIDVSLPPKPQGAEAQPASSPSFAEKYGSFPVASLEERRFAAVIDIFCLMFAYGGFLALFGSLGGQFTISKLSAAVYVATLAIVYLQYFALFTIFGGTTPGMMFRGLQVSSFDGDPPRPRQMILRSFGYVLSAGTFFLGFLWACWDEDALTWHDRLSRTYLSVAETFANEAAEPAHR